MNTLTTVSEVVFRRPFLLNGLEGLQPPGTYKIESYSELLDTTSALVYRRLSTSIELHGQPAGIIRTATIDPLDLETALRSDGAAKQITGAGRGIEADAVEAQTTPVPNETVVSMRAAPVEAGVDWRRHAATPAGDRRGHWRQWLAMNSNELTWIGLALGSLTLLHLSR